MFEFSSIEWLTFLKTDERRGLYKSIASLVFWRLQRLKHAFARNFLLYPPHILEAPLVLRGKHFLSGKATWNFVILLTLIKFAVVTICLGMSHFLPDKYLHEILYVRYISELVWTFRGISSFCRARISGDQLCSLTKMQPIEMLYDFIKITLFS